MLCEIIDNKVYIEFEALDRGDFLSLGLYCEKTGAGNSSAIFECDILGMPDGISEIVNPQIKSRGELYLSIGIATFGIIFSFIIAYNGFYETLVGEYIPGQKLVSSIGHPDIVLPIVKYIFLILSPILSIFLFVLGSFGLYMIYSATRIIPPGVRRAFGLKGLLREYKDAIVRTGEAGDE